jgi:pyruvate/2-oxoglutarate dehydrogenase complex dihydrolipoamide acyltransferase (E2) component
MDYTTLRADAHGVISAVMAEPGQVVAASAPIVRLAHTAEQEAAVSIPETLLDRARSEPARVEFWALPGVSVAAKLRELSPTSDPATRTYPARFTLIGALHADRRAVRRAARDGHHRLAQHGHGKGGSGAGRGSVRQGGGAERLGGRSRQRGVTGRASRAGRLRRRAGLHQRGRSGGAKIVALGVHKLSEGEEVRVVENLAGL